jgi:hypothetical protein
MWSAGEAQSRAHRVPGDVLAGVCGQAEEGVLTADHQGADLLILQAARPASCKGNGYVHVPGAAAEIMVQWLPSPDDCPVQAAAPQIIL